MFEGPPEVLPEQPERAGTWGHFIGGTDSSWGMWISLEKLEFSVPAPEHLGGVSAPTEVSPWGWFAVMCNQGHQHGAVPLEPQEMQVCCAPGQAAQLFSIAGSKPQTN